MPTTVNERILNAMIGHQVGLLRFDRGIVNAILELLADTRDELEDVLRARLRRALGREHDSGPATTARVAQQLVAVTEFLNEFTDTKVQPLLLDDLEDLAGYEARFAGKLLAGSIPLEYNFTLPTAETLHGLITAMPYPADGAQFYGEQVSDFAVWQARQIAQRVLTGVTAGNNLDTIVASVIGTQGMRYSDGVWTDRSKRHQVSTLVRTAVSHAASVTREQTYRENSDLVKGVQWVSTLDARTTLICAELSGQVFEVGKGPRPPAHYRCRSVTAPVLVSFEELAGKGAKAPEGERASMDGTVPESVTYEPWLRSQPAAVQDHVLGPTRGRLFRANADMRLRQFSDDVGRPMALADLAASDAKLFLSLSENEILDMARWIGEARAKTLAARTARKARSHLRRASG